MFIVIFILIIIILLHGRGAVMASEQTVVVVAFSATRISGGQELEKNCSMIVKSTYYYVCAPTGVCRSPVAKMQSRMMMVCYINKYIPFSICIVTFYCLTARLRSSITRINNRYEPYSTMGVQCDLVDVGDPRSTWFVKLPANKLAWAFSIIVNKIW